MRQHSLRSIGIGSTSGTSIESRRDDEHHAIASDRRPLLSIVVPVYRPSLWYFRECIQSVIDQTYRNWELCLCDDGSDDPELTKVIAECAEGDRRIKAVVLERNGGISRATNRALSQSER